MDIITGFSAGGADHIELNMGISNFSYIGASAFTNSGITQARFDNDTKILEIDINGDGVSDTSIQLLGVNITSLDSTDFIWS